LPWAQVMRWYRAERRPGYHVSVLAPTRYGKSRLTRNLLKTWDYVLTFDVKGDDPETVGRRIDSYPSRARLWRDRSHHYRIVGMDPARYRRVFSSAWRSGYESREAGSWVLHLGECYVMSDRMGLEDDLVTLWVTGGGKGLTVVAETQRPANVPHEFYDQSAFQFLGWSRDAYTIRRLSEVGGDTELIRAVVPSLDWDRHEFLVLGPGGRDMFITRAP
jgi:hypothetical protein